MANGQPLFKVTAFSNDFQYSPRGGVVYYSVDMTREQADALVAQEEENNPSFWLKIEEQV